MPTSKTLESSDRQILDDEEELTAWHESGHAFMAVLCGGIVERVSIEPPDDDGPNRYGDTIVRWESIAAQAIPLLELKVCLSGPISESIYRGDSRLAEIDLEWQWDWENAMAAASRITRPERFEKLMAVVAAEIWQRFDTANSWSAISAIAEELLTHSTLEHDQVSEIAEFWILRETT